jgi:uncharacterized repeat protein (TIGR03943 family)
VNKETQSIVVALLGGLLISITLSHRFTSYVRPGFAPLLLIGGGILVLVGALSLILAIRADAKKDRARAAGKAATGVRAVQAGAAEGPAATTLAATTLAATTPTAVAAAVPDHVDHEDPGVHGHPHDHDHDKSKAPWLILIPVLVLLLVAPPALGADAVARNASSQALAGVDVVARESSTSKDGAGAGGGYKFNDGSGSAADSTGSRRTMHFPALPAGANPSIGMKDLILRALYDADNSVEGIPVTVTGFIAPPGDGYTDGYTVARIVISCCAADANPMQLHIAGDAPFPANTWVDAVVTVVPNTATIDNGYVPTVTMTSMTPVPQPDDPYEH